MESTTNDYQSYLLRLWRVNKDGYPWRASLEDVQTGEMHGFEELVGLLDYLDALTASEQPEQVLAGREGTNR